MLVQYIPVSACPKCETALCIIWGCCDSNFEARDSGLPGCDTVLLGQWFLTFSGNSVLSPWWVKQSKTAFEALGTTHLMIWHTSQKTWILSNTTNVRTTYLADFFAQSVAICLSNYKASCSSRNSWWCNIFTVDVTSCIRWRYRCPFDPLFP
jgi:hypothetical protein